MRKAIFLASEAWRHKYKQLATERAGDHMVKIDYKLPSGEIVTLQGWREETRAGPDGEKRVFVGPDGEPYDSLEYAYEAVQGVVGTAQEKHATVQALHRLLPEFK